MITHKNELADPTGVGAAGAVFRVDGFVIPLPVQRTALIRAMEISRG